MQKSDKPSILIVDDEKNITRFLNRFLKKSFDDVRIANSGKEAVDMIHQSPPDILITDLHIPDMDGRRISKFALNLIPDLVVIVITGYGSLETAVGVMKDGAADFLQKPIRLAELEMAIASASQRWRLKRDLRIATECLQQKNAELAAIFRSIPEGIITTDHLMNITQKNNSVSDICALNGHLVPGMRIDKISEQCRGECLTILRHTLDTGQIVKEYHTECRQNEQTLRHLILSSSPLSDAEGAILIIRDVTLLTTLEDKLRERESYKNIIGRSEKMQRVYTLIRQLADADTTVLITGESGTGKELVMEALHYGGTRASEPLIRVNCSALSENLLESELFGHVRGAFTGAFKDRIGRFETANRGTVFLDEIGDISSGIQLKLLRFIESKEFERVGDNKTMKADARIIAATNSDLSEKIRKGLFREDLYYRINVMNIHLPPLRERTEDIPLLVRHFCGMFAKTFSKRFKGVSDDVLDIFMRYPWHGNVRELKHVIEHACILCPGGTIGREYLHQKIAEYQGNITSDTDMSGEPDKETLLKTLAKTDGNKAKTARMLGISRSTLYRRLAEAEID